MSRPGAFGLLWLAIWWPLYGSPATHPRVGPGELALIRSDPPDTPVRIPWLTLLGYRQTWAFAIGKFGTDPIWWLYLFWIPDFLHRRHGINLQSMALPLVVIYLVADVGSIGGGWLSSSLLKRGWSANRARKTAMLACALAVVPMAFTAKRRQRVDGGRAARHRDGGAPGLVGQPLHAARRTCFRAMRSDRSSASAAWPARLAAC